MLYLVQVEAVNLTARSPAEWGDRNRRIISFIEYFSSLAFIFCMNDRYLDRDMVMKGEAVVRIEPYNPNTQQARFSGTGKIGNVSLPDYSSFHFNTKTVPSMSAEKYKDAIIEQARKDQAAGKFQSESAGFRSLVKSYVSAVSPDRKKIINEGLTAVFKNNKPQPKTLNLIDYLFGKVKYEKEANDVSYAEFYDSNGEMVASYSNGGWTFYGTKAENTRESELWGIYNEAWNSATRANINNIGNAIDETGESSINITV